MADVKDLAYEDYRRGMKYKDIAEKHGVKISTIKSWVNRYWKNRDEKGCNQESKKVATKTKKSQPEKEEKQAAKKTEKAIARSEAMPDKHQLFCIFWIKNKNATLAAIKAGYEPESAHVEGSRLLKNAKVREYINLFITEVKNNVMISTEEIVERYMKIAFADITDFVDFYPEEMPVINRGKIVTVPDATTGEPIPVTKTVNAVHFKDSRLIDGGLIREISTGKDGAKIKLEDRQKALEWLSRYFQMNPMDRHKIDYDLSKLKMELARAEAAIKTDDQADIVGSNFADALGSTVEEA